MPAAEVKHAFPDDPMGLIPTKYLYDPIEVRLKKIWAAPAGEHFTDIVHYTIDPHGPETPYPLDPITLTGPVTADQFPLSTYITGNWLRINGSYDLTYYIEGPGGIEHSPYKTTFTVDWTPPGGTNPMLAADLPEEVELHGITEDYLSEHETVDLKITLYVDRQKFDEVRVFLLSSSSANPHEPVFTYTLTSDSGPIIIPVPVEVFRQLENGFRGIRYSLGDRAGNWRLDYSRYTEVLIDLKAPPVGLQLPYVAAYAFDNLIDRQDAREGVMLQINPYFNHEDTDDAVVSWNGILLDKVPVDDLPKLVHIHWPELIAKGYLQNNFPVTYSIHRAGSNTGPSSPTLRVTADYSIAGKDHAQAPAEFNATLAQVEVRGAGSDQANHLDYRDSGKAVTVTLVLDAGYAVGHWIGLYWGALEDPVVTYWIKAEDKAGEPVTFPLVPWTVVEQTLVDPQFPVYYRTHNGVNDQLAPHQSVNINIAAPESFDPPEAPDTDDGWFNCQSDPPIWEGVRIRINKHPAIKPGDELRLKWVGTTEFAGGSVIPETVGVFIENWSDTDQQVGFHILTIPYEPNTQPLKNEAGGAAEFNVWRGGVLVGASKRPRYLKFDRRYASNPTVYCGPGGIGPEKS
ncbi:hypothetical protein [Pseudomonas sp. 18175]|uniref:hypothetical protein n=1 Tax=Pseudomonas sp. 18175 TaxID=3390056 RepID=UPI003D21E26E